MKMTLRLNLSGLIRYLTTADARRLTKAREIRDQSDLDYSPATDFWRPMRVGIYNDRRTVRDGSIVQATADGANSKKRASYSAVADLWPAIAGRWEPATFHRPSGADLIIGGLDIAVRALFSEEWPDGTIEDVTVWMNQEEPSDDAVTGALRLLTRADPAPASIATFVDARRGTVWSSNNIDADQVDLWLERVGARFLADADV